MDRAILLSAIGFRPEMVVPLVKAMAPDEVFLIAGKHPTVVAAEREVLRQLKGTHVQVKVEHVRDWDMLAWSQAIRAALDRYQGDRVTVNVTAGHGLAVSMLAVHAAAHSLPVACFDWEGQEAASDKDPLRFVKAHSPAAILNLTDTQPVDRRLLGLLLGGPQTVGALASHLGLPQSTVSTSLARLVKGGFLDRKQEGRMRIYSLRAGIEAFVSQGLHGSPETGGGVDA